MIKFEKVSYEQFKKDYLEINVTSILWSIDSDEEIDTEIRDIYDNIKLPERSTRYSAGYDFFAPYSFTIPRDGAIVVPTGIKVFMDTNMFLSIHPRSGLGFKWGMRLYNSTGVIDADYVQSSNEGHIICKFATDVDYECAIPQGNGMAQGIFMKYYTTDNDDITEKHNERPSSTGKDTSYLNSTENMFIGDFL